MTPSEALRERVLAAAAATPAPARRQTVLRDLGIFGLAFGVSMFVFSLAGGARTEPRPPSLVLGTAIGLGLLALTTWWIAGRRGRSMLGRPRALIVGSVLLVPLLFLGWKLLYSGLFEGMTEEWPERVGLRCFALSLGTGASPFVALLIARRGSDPVAPAVTGAGLGLAAGAFAAVLTDLWCPVAYLPHLLLGHVLPMVAFTCIGALIGRWMLALRR